MPENVEHSMNKEADQQLDKRAKPVRNNEKPIQKYRLTVQIAFAMLCVWIGVQFHFFVRFLDSGGTTTFVNRPPGVEGFLPISSLMSLYYFFLTGEIHAAHQAGLFILTAILIMGLLQNGDFYGKWYAVGLSSYQVGRFSGFGGFYDADSRLFEPHLPPRGAIGQTTPFRPRSGE